MLLFVLLFGSLFRGLVYSLIKIIKEHKIDVLKIVSFTNVILFILIFVFAK